MHIVLSVIVSYYRINSTSHVSIFSSGCYLPAVAEFYSSLCLCVIILFCRLHLPFSLLSAYLLHDSGV